MLTAHAPVAPRHAALLEHMRLREGDRVVLQSEKQRGAAAGGRVAIRVSRMPLQRAAGEAGEAQQQQQQQAAVAEDEGDDGTPSPGAPYDPAYDFVWEGDEHNGAGAWGGGSVIAAEQRRRCCVPVAALASVCASSIHEPRAAPPAPCCSRHQAAHTRRVQAGQRRGARCARCAALCQPLVAARAGQFSCLVGAAACECQMWLRGTARATQHTPPPPAPGADAARAELLLGQDSLVLRLPAVGRDFQLRLEDGTRGIHCPGTHSDGSCVRPLLLLLPLAVAAAWCCCCKRCALPPAASSPEGLPAACSTRSP